MKTITFAIFALALLGAVAAQDAAAPATNAEEAIYASLETGVVPSCDMFLTFMGQANLNEYMQDGEKEQTIFCPSDKAFEALNLTMESTEALQTNKLDQVLLYHIIPNRAYTLADLTKMVGSKSVNVETAQGQNMVLAASKAVAEAGNPDAPALALPKAAAAAAAGAAGATAAAVTTKTTTVVAKPAAAAASPSPKPAASPATGRRLLQEDAPQAEHLAGEPEDMFVFDGTKAAQVIWKDLKGGKTIIHVIDAVLLPPAEAKAVEAVVTNPPPALKESGAASMVASMALAAVPLFLAVLL